MKIHEKFTELYESSTVCMKKGQTMPEIKSQKQKNVRGCIEGWNKHPQSNIRKSGKRGSDNSKVCCSFNVSLKKKVANFTGNLIKWANNWLKNFSLSSQLNVNTFHKN